MRLFFWIVLWSLLLGLLVRVPIGGAGILAMDFLMVGFGSLWLWKKIAIERKLPAFPLPLIFWIFLGWGLITFLHGAIHLDLMEKIVSFSHLMRLFFAGIFGWAAYDLYQNSDPQKFFRPLWWLIFIWLVLGFVQYFFIPNLIQYSTEGGFDPHMGRLLGTWMDPNFFGGFVGFLSPVILALFYDTREKKWLWLFLLALVALFLTFSRSGYLSAIAGLLIFLWFRDRKIISIGILCVIIGIFYSPRAQERLVELWGTMKAVVMQDTNEVDPTASLRIQSWMKTLKFAEKNLWMGIGYNTYRYRAAQEGLIDSSFFSAGGSDSSHLNILVTMGIPGLILFLLLWGQIFWRSFRVFWVKKSTLFLGFCGGWVSLFFHSFFVNSLFFPLIFLPVLAILGVFMARDKEQGTSIKIESGKL